MDSMQRFEAVCSAMAEPEFYPHPVSAIERRDTHISSVFLTGKWVYKLKKPVDFGFLDFCDIDKRRRFCEIEVSLNKRLTAGIYHEVVVVYEDLDGRFFFKKDMSLKKTGSFNKTKSFNKTGRIAEYAVKMTQLPDAVNLYNLLKDDKVDIKKMKDLGQKLAGFYESSNQSPKIDHYGQKEVIGFNMEENFRQLEPFIKEFQELEKWEFICHVGRSFLENRQNLFEDRLKTGRIRDGHGDLRTDHIYFYKGIQIIDCIEFNDRFRYGDVVSDLAFLHMDLEHLGYPDLSLAFLSAYVDCADDPQLYSLLDFYAAYRAVVKLKTTCFRIQEVKDAGQKALKTEAGFYLNQAYRYTLQFSRPTLLVFCGMPATGKSYLAQTLAKALSLTLFQSDYIRKHIHKEGLSHGNQKVEAFGKGLYRQQMRHHVYSQMLALAQKTLKGGHSVILDATFSKRKWRDEAMRLSKDLDTNIIFVECVCKPETIRKRLGQRDGMGNGLGEGQGDGSSNLSDARLEHFPQISKDFEPLFELNSQIHLTVDTELPLRDNFLYLLSKGYACKCAQVKNQIKKFV